MIYYYDYTQAIDNKYSRDSWIEDTPPTSFEFEEESILILPPPKDSLPGWKYVFKCSQKVSFYLYKVYNVFVVLSCFIKFTYHLTTIFSAIIILWISSTVCISELFVSTSSSTSGLELDCIYCIVCLC